jgi:hypothetical protein
MEKVFQSNPRAKHRFIKMVYLSACQGEQEIDPLVQYLKSQLGVCISLAECRQLILYSSLFGETSSPTPSKESMKQVVTNMYLRVPQLFYYQKWCRDVKRLETKKNDGMKPTTGYFSNKWKSNDGVSNGSVSPDLLSILTNINDDASHHSNHSFSPTTEIVQDLNQAPQGDLHTSTSPTSTRHLAMLQAIANGEDDEEVAPPPPKPKAIHKFRKIALGLVAMGSDLSSLPSPDAGIVNHTPFEANQKRRIAQSNVYMLSDAPEYRKLVATLARGDSTISSTGVILNPPKDEDDNDHHHVVTWRSHSNLNDSNDADDAPPIGFSGFSSGINPSNGKNEVNIFNVKGDPIKDGYYVGAASRIEVLNFLPSYDSAPSCLNTSRVGHGHGHGLHKAADPTDQTPVSSPNQPETTPTAGHLHSCSLFCFCLSCSLTHS